VSWRLLPRRATPDWLPLAVGECGPVSMLEGDNGGELLTRATHSCKLKIQSVAGIEVVWIKGRVHAEFQDTSRSMAASLGPSIFLWDCRLGGSGDSMNADLPSSPSVQDHRPDAGAVPARRRSQRGCCDSAPPIRPARTGASTPLAGRGVGKPRSSPWSIRCSVTSRMRAMATIMRTMESKRAGIWVPSRTGSTVA